MDVVENFTSSFEDFVIAASHSQSLDKLQLLVQRIRDLDIEVINQYTTGIL